MSTLTGTYVQTGLSGVSRINTILDTFLSPHIVEFRQIIIYHEPGVRVSSNKWRFTYQHWNPDYAPEVFLNGSTTPIVSTTLTIDNAFGTVTLPGTFTTGDNLVCTYCFDYFPIYVLEGFVYRAIEVINSAPAGVPTTYTIDNIPTNWFGIIADIVLSMCMEKLIIEYDLWKGRLVFALTPEELMSGGGSVMESLTTIKQNAEERANQAMQNAKLKSPPYLAVPTTYYYSAITMGGSTWNRMRGWRGNRLGTNLP